MRRGLTISVLTGLLVLEAFASTPSAQSQSWLVKVPPILQYRLTQWLGRSRVVMTATNSSAVGPPAPLVQLTRGHVPATPATVHALVVRHPHPTVRLMPGQRA